jgi:hypothetical protein
MKHFVLALYYRLRGEPEVANALKQFNKAAKKLEKAATYQAAKAIAAAQAAEAAWNAKLTAEAEAERAAKVRKNIADLLEL